MTQFDRNTKLQFVIISLIFIKIMFSNMQPINRIFNFYLKSCIFNHEIKINSISSQLIRCHSTIPLRLKPSPTQRQCLLIAKQSEIRCLSTNSFNTDTGQKISPISPSKEAKSEPKVVKSAPKPIGIIGFENEEFKEVKEWIPIYLFPFIVHAKTFCRLKLLQTMISCTIVPMSFTLYYFGLTTMENCNFSTMVSIFAMAMMYVFGNLFRRLVGRVYVSDDGSLVRLSHLSFFGNRVDEDIDVTDIVPIKETNFELNDLYCRIERYSTSEVLFISLKFGGILNRDRFEKIFGKGSSDISVRRMY